jgi:hypothetical protein
MRGTAGHRSSPPATLPKPSVAASLDSHSTATYSAVWSHWLKTTHSPALLVVCQDPEPGQAPAARLWFARPWLEDRRAGSKHPTKVRTVLSER